MRDATTDASGVATFAGTRELDPAARAARLRLQTRRPEDCPRLFVRVDGARGMALMPLDYRVRRRHAIARRATPCSSRAQPEYGHLHAWGTTAQGVYRAGDTMEWKVYVRDQSNESLVAAPAGPYMLEIIDPTGQVVHTVADATLSKFGALSGTFAIPQSAAVGWYQFRLTAKFGEPPSQPGERRAASELVRFPLRVLVSDFTPSPFGVRTTLNGDLFEAGEEVTARDARDAVLGRAVHRRRSAHDGAARRAAVPLRARRRGRRSSSTPASAAAPPIVLAQQSTQSMRRAKRGTRSDLAEDLGQPGRARHASRSKAPCATIAAATSRARRAPSSSPSIGSSG